MGCTTSNTTVEKQKGKIIFIYGYPSAGKTFTGDYLETLPGWVHIDGDRIGADHSPASYKKQEIIQSAIRTWTQTEDKPPEKDWIWYYREFIEDAKKFQRQGKNSVISAVVYKRYVRDILRALCPDLIFIHLKVPLDMLLKRLEERQKKMLDNTGEDPKAYWDNPEYPDMARAKAKYGEYSWDNMIQYLKDEYMSGMEDLAEDESNSFTIQNHDFKDNKSLKEVHKVLGIEQEVKVNVKALEQVALARFGLFIPPEPKQGKRGKVVFLHGYPCAGKTFYTDYLVSQGWAMIDGDYKLYSKNNQECRNFYKSVNAMYHKFAGRDFVEQDWDRFQQHYVELGQKANKLADSGKNVVVSFIAPQSFLRDLIRKEVPDITLIKIHVDTPALVEKNFKRCEDQHAQMGMTLEEGWAYEEEEMNAVRQRYGEKYSEETYKKWLADEWYNSYDKLQEHEQPYCKEVENTEFNINGLKQLRAYCGLGGNFFKYEPEKLIAIQAKRYATVNPAAYMDA